jgi:hypothetical protein
VAGASAQHEYERRRARRKAVDRRVLPWVAIVAVVLLIVSYIVLENSVPGVGWGGPLLILALVIPFLGLSRQEVNWRRGAEGERIVGAALDALERSGFRSLHDRRMPRSRANIDHITVADGRAYTVDAKRYSGAIAVRRGSALFTPWSAAHPADRRTGRVAPARRRASRRHRPSVPSRAR